MLKWFLHLMIKLIIIVVLILNRCSYILFSLKVDLVKPKPSFNVDVYDRKEDNNVGMRKIEVSALSLVCH